MQQGKGLAGVVVAVEVAARIVARWAAGEQVQQIGRDLHLTPAEVRQVLRDTTSAGAARAGGRGNVAGPAL